MRKKSVSFRVGKVQACLRGKMWYLCYHENGQRHYPHIGTNREAARQLAAEVHAQIEVGAPAALSFEPISVSELRRRWLEHHEQVLRSSIRTILFTPTQERALLEACDDLGRSRTGYQPAFAVSVD
jgi:integrase